MGRQARSSPSFRPGVERLEDRTVPTTLYATVANNVLLRFDSATPGKIDSQFSAFDGASLTLLNSFVAYGGFRGGVFVSGIRS